MDDERVPAWMPLKWLAKWRCLSDGSSQINDNLVLCRVYEDGGHFGSSRVSREVQVCCNLVIPMKLNANQFNHFY